jgi:hypothetical protein
MENKFVYIRAVAAVGDDDAVTVDSACYPLSSFSGAAPSDDGKLSLFFKSMTNYDGFDNTGDAVVHSDEVVLNFLPVNTHKEVMEGVINAFSSDRDGMIVLGDDVTGEYCFSEITSVESIDVSAVNS